MTTVADLAREAVAAAREGRMLDAERLWREVLQLDERNPQAMFSLGVHAMQRGDHARGREWLQLARNLQPRDLLTLMTLAAACRLSKDAAGELEAIDAALTVDPYHLPALLARGFWFDAQGRKSSAATVLRNALRVAPPEPDWPPVLRDQLHLARRIVQAHSTAYEKHLLERVGGLHTDLPPAARSRWREAVSILAGRSSPFVSQSNQLCVPRLPAVTFFERDAFPWAESLEARTADIRAELERLLAAGQEGFEPYIHYNPGEPVNQWAELNRSPRWNAFHLWRSGSRVEANLARCPVTAAALAEVGMATISGLCPNAMFSALAPRTRIPPHHGETNARVIVHLPLVVPPGCRYRVGYDECDWEVGRILAFDDTLEHEARNDGEELRVVLIFDVWNPLLSPAEQRLVDAMVEAARGFGD
jgi:aspartyl/asparaginyl beta-hydroxylase (cupin superfamily)